MPEMAQFQFSEISRDGNPKNLPSKPCAPSHQSTQYWASILSQPMLELMYLLLNITVLNAKQLLHCYKSKRNISSNAEMANPTHAQTRLTKLPSRVKRSRTLYTNPTNN
jgi:hypothetical protein